MSEAENDAAWVAKLIITERDATITALREEVRAKGDGWKAAFKIAFEWQEAAKSAEAEVAQARKAAAEALYGEGNDPGYPLPEMIEALKVLAQNGIALTALRRRVVEVVGPFAVEAERHEHQPADSGVYYTGPALRAGHLRAARALVNEMETTK